MIEIYGWINVIGPENDELDSGDEFDRKIDALRSVKSLADEIGSRSLVLNHAVVNGQVLLSILGCANHPSPDWETSIKIFEAVGKEAPMSFGILHMRNLDLPDDKGDKFNLWILRKGILQLEDDTFLSPCSVRIGID